MSGRVREIGRKLWNSPTATQWLNLLIKPLRLFLLTPLIVLKFSNEEIDLFYILASVGGFASVITVLIPNVFSPVLIYYYGGLRNLKDVGKSRESASEPNWKGFVDAFATLGRFQFWLIFPLILLVGCLIYGSISRRLGSSNVELMHWIAGSMLITRTVFDLFVTRFGVVLRAIGCVALNNRLNVVFAALSVIFSALVILAGGGLIEILVTQFLISTVQRVNVASVAKKMVMKLNSGRYSREVFDHVRRPLFRATTGVVFSAGIERLTPALLAGSLSKQDFPSYSISMGLGMTILSASRGVIESQIPSYTKIYSQGHLNGLEEKGTARVAFSVFLFLAAFVVLGPFTLIFLNNLGSKVAFVNLWVWLLIGFLLLLRHLSLSFAMLYNVTNERPFYLHVIAGGIILLSAMIFLWVKDITISVPIAALISILPQVLVLNWLPLFKFSKLTGVSVRKICVNLVFQMRPDRIVRGVLTRFSRG